jgi:hypothetical protein
MNLKANSIPTSTIMETRWNMAKGIAVSPVQVAGIGDRMLARSSSGLYVPDDVLWGSDGPRRQEDDRC